jgi:hypothetical protein
MSTNDNESVVDDEAVELGTTNASINAESNAIAQEELDVLINPPSSQYGAELGEISPDQIDDFPHDEWQKVRQCRQTAYQILDVLVSISRYLETNYRYDDILAVNTDLAVTLKISEYFEIVSIMTNNVIRTLQHDTLPPSVHFKESMDWILLKIRAVITYLDPADLREDTLQMRDWALVNTATIAYCDDDGGKILPQFAAVDQSYFDRPLYRPFCTPGVYTMTLDQFKNSKLNCQHRDHDMRFMCTNTVNLSDPALRLQNDQKWMEMKANLDISRNYMYPSSLTQTPIPALLQQRIGKTIPTTRSAWSAASSASASSSSSSSAQSAPPPSSVSPFTSMRMFHPTIGMSTPGRGVNPVTSGGYPATPGGGIPTFGGYPVISGSVNKTGPFSPSATGISSVMLTSDLPKLVKLTGLDLTNFLESCESKSLSNEQIMNQIIDDVKFLIGVKLTNAPMPSYSIAENKDWKNQIDIRRLLHYLQTVVTHGSQSNESIVQSALHEIKFFINVQDETTIDTTSLLIRNTLIKGLPTAINNDVTLQSVMIKQLKSLLLKSKPTKFCQNVHSYIESLGRTVHDVESFVTAFNAKSIEIIRLIADADRYREHNDNNNNNNNNNIKHHGNDPRWKKARVDNRYISLLHGETLR